MLKILTLDEMIAHIPRPQRTHIQNIYNIYSDQIAAARGSKTKHQAWSGGYLDHLGEMGAMGISLYDLMQNNWKRKLPFTLSDIMIVILLHDIEKPFKHKTVGDSLVDSIADPDEWKNAFLKAHNISLSEQQTNALQYIHGENKHYDQNKRVMNELGSFCHTLDTLSARLFYNYPEHK